MPDPHATDRDAPASPLPSATGEVTGERMPPVLYAVVIDEKHGTTICSDQPKARGPLRPWVFFTEAEADAQREEHASHWGEFTYRTVPLVATFGGNDH